jgi:hypothetical protein
MNVESPYIETRECKCLRLDYEEKDKIICISIPDYCG